MLKIGLPLTVLVAVLDQLSKWRIEEFMRPQGMTETPFYGAPTIDVTSFFMLVMAWNRGASFGFLNQASDWVGWAFTALAAVVAAALLFWMSRAENKLLAISLGFIAGGAIGNAIDRIRFGAVADFLYFHWGDWFFPAFNLADSAITVGAGLLILESLFKRPGSSYKEAP
jgi:signal peptidase II